MGQKSPRAGINSQQVFMVKCVGLVKVGGVLREWLNNGKKNERLSERTEQPYKD